MALDWGVEFPQSAKLGYSSKDKPASSTSIINMLVKVPFFFIAGFSLPLRAGEAGPPLLRSRILVSRLFV